MRNSPTGDGNRGSERAYRAPVLATPVAPLAERDLSVEDGDGTPLDRTRLAWISTAAKVAVGVLAAVFLLTHLSEITSAAGAVARSNPFWIAVAVAMAGFSYVLAAWTLGAATPLRLPFGRTVAAQLAAASANRLSPAGLGGMGLNMRYLEASGSSRSAALGAVGLGQVSSFAARLLLIVGMAAMTRRTLPLHVPLQPGWILVATVIAALVVGAAMLVRRRMLLRLLALLVGSVASVLAHVREVASEPRRLMVLLVGSAGIGLAHAAALTACVAAVGGHLGPTDAIFVYLTGSAMSAAVPSPGGVGAVEAALVAGLGHLSVPGAVAVAGVISFRLVTYWLPIVPGLVCAAALRRRHAI